MRNNKPINIAETAIGTRVKVAIPSYWAHHKKDKLKKYSWFKAKLLLKGEGGFTLMIYPKHFIGRMYFFGNNYPKIVKCK